MRIARGADLAQLLEPPADHLEVVAAALVPGLPARGTGPLVLGLGRAAPLFVAAGLGHAHLRRELDRLRDRDHGDPPRADRRSVAEDRPRRARFATRGQRRLGSVRRSRRVSCPADGDADGPRINGTRDRRSDRAGERGDPRRRDRGRGPLRASARPAICARNAPARPSRSSRPASGSAEPGISSATPASAPTATCTPSATPSSPGAAAQRDRRRRPSILDYVRETAREHGVEKQIRFGHRLRRAAWSSAEDLWTLEIERTERSWRPSDRGARPTTLRCRFLSMCSGYYRYDRGHAPQFEGMERFRGRIVHPQFWPEDLDYAGKRVAVIGSGATAITLVPAMAKTAAHVTMIQRSPTWIVSLPAVDRIAVCSGASCPKRLAYRLTRGEERRASSASSTARRGLRPARSGSSCSPRSAANSDRTSTSRSTSRRATTPGTSASAWSPTPISSSPSARAAPSS